MMEENLYLLLTLSFSQYLYANLTRCHVSMVVGSDIAQQPSHISSIITSMTQHVHRAMAKSPRSAIANMTRHIHRVVATSLRQHHRQYDSALTSCRGQIALVVSSPA
jgi:hypothetical protein